MSCKVVSLQGTGPSLKPGVLSPSGTFVELKQCVKVQVDVKVQSQQEQKALLAGTVCKMSSL